MQDIEHIPITKFVRFTEIPDTYLYMAMSNETFRNHSKRKIYSHKNSSSSWGIEDPSKNSIQGTQPGQKNII